MGDKIEYGVKCENKFAIIDDDDDGLNDPYDLLKKLNVTSQQPTSKSAPTQKQTTVGKDDKSKLAPNKKPAVVVPPKGVVSASSKNPAAPKNVVTSSTRPPTAAVGNVPRKPVPASTLPPRFNKAAAPPGGEIAADQTTPINANTNFQPNFEDNKNPQRGYYGRGGFRGSRGGGGGFARGSRQDGGGGYGRGRQFERQSGSDKTGVKSMDKREGGGAYNWGTPNDDLIGETENLGGGGGFSAEEMIGGPPAAAENGPAAVVNNEEGGETKGELRADEKQEPEVQQFTLDEWKAMHGERNKPEFNVRHAGEGEHEKAEWKKLVPLKGQPQTKKQKKRKEEIVHVVESARDDEEDERHRKLQNVVEIDIRFGDVPSRGARRGGGGFAGRGRTNGGPPIDGAGGQSGFSGFGRGGGVGGYNAERRRGGGQNAGSYKRDRDVPFKMDEQAFPTLA